MPDEQMYPDVEEVEFEKSTLEKLYKSSLGINPERYLRIQREVRFSDVVAECTGQTGDMIHCPFHGRDSRPSFWTKGDFGYCFGCPPGEMYYDAVRFASMYNGMSRLQALKWIEKKWDLPTLADVKLPSEEEEVVTLVLSDLTEPYIVKAIREIQAVKDVELAEEYLRFYFEALHLEKLADEAKKQGELDDAEDYRTKAALTLARILGREELDNILARKG